MIVVWLPRAKADRRRLTAHIPGDRPRAALEQGGRIRASIGHLADNPDLGRRGRVPSGISELRPQGGLGNSADSQSFGTRERVVPRTPYIVVYRRVAPGRIELLRILHGAQQWPPEP